MDEKVKEIIEIINELEDEDSELHNTDAIAFRYSEVKYLLSLLSEKEADNKGLRNMVDSYRNTCENWEKILSEKEKEIEELKANRDYWARICKEAQEQRDFNAVLHRSAEARIKELEEELSKIK